MTTPNLSTTDLRTSEEARDLQTLLFIDLHTSLGAEPEGILRLSASTSLTTTIFTLTCMRKSLSILLLKALVLL